ncbi:MAG TPA: diguanylate cyclase [Armatimonadota bacterium]|nr:diguanylate cyclase [Armatimonadota bacterium]
MDSSIEQLPYTILVVEPDATRRGQTQDRLSTLCFTQEAVSIEDAKELFKIVPVHIVLVHDSLPDGDGVDLCSWIADVFPDTVRVLYGTSPDVAKTLKAINDGHVRFYLTGDCEIESIFGIAEKALATYSVSAANAAMIEQLRSANHLLERKVEQSTRELVALNEELRIVLDEMQTLTVMDEQTGLYNRRAMLDKLDEAFRQSARYKTSLSCLICDIADFKQVNDTYGTDDCDELLHEMAIRIRGSIRDVDLACRAGGDEFLVILPHTNSAQAHIVAERLYRMLVDRPYTAGNREIAVKLNFGIAQVTSSVRNAATLFKRAEEAETGARHADRPLPINIYPDEENASPDTVAPNTGRRPE